MQTNGTQRRKWNAEAMGPVDQGDWEGDAKTASGLVAMSTLPEFI